MSNNSILLCPDDTLISHTMYNQLTTSMDQPNRIATGCFLAQEWSAAFQVGNHFLATDMYCASEARTCSKQPDANWCGCQDTQDYDLSTLSTQRFAFMLEQFNLSW